MANVLLLRAPSQDGPDKYEDCFLSHGYRPISIPVLETVLTNTSELGAFIYQGHRARGYAGVIITSARACEAWRTAAQQFVPRESGGELVAYSKADWSAIPFYVVGEATARALEEASRSIGKSLYTPTDIRGSSESGTSEKLAHFILKDLSSTTGSRKLLYLTGDKNRDTLPTILKEGGFDLEPLQVYKTQGSSKFCEDLQYAFPFALSGKWWIVYFAPSAASFVTPLLRQYFELPAIDPSPNTTSLPVPSIAAIGPTTSTFLREELKLRVHADPPKPTPEALVAALMAADADSPEAS